MNIANEVAKAFIARATAQKMKRGVARDKAALEFCCGAGAALQFVKPADAKEEAEMKGQRHSLELLAFMVSCRGYVYLEESTRELIKS